MASKNGASIVDTFKPDSPAGTEFLRLYHGLKSNEPAEKSASFLFTSAVLGEGKSLSAAMLALTMGILKKKTLLIDCDLRRPTIHRLFNVYLEEGVTEICNGSLPLARGYKATSLANLSVLTAGRLAHDPTSYFEDGLLTKIIRQAESQFDYIILDCAPVMPVVDPLVIATEVTGVILVVKAGATHRDLVKQATDALVKAGAPLKGVLLNNVKGVLPYQYNARYSYQYYTPTAD